jgi:hypothetical protein
MSDEEINKAIAEVCRWKILEKQDEEMGYYSRLWVSPFYIDRKAKENICVICVYARYKYSRNRTFFRTLCKWEESE